MAWPLLQTVLRRVLAERMYEARLDQIGARAHPDFEQFRRDGFIRKDLDKLTVRSTTTCC